MAAATVAEVTEMETPTDTKVVEAEEATEEARAADTEEDKVVEIACPTSVLVFKSKAGVSCGRYLISDRKLT